MYCSSRAVCYRHMVYPLRAGIQLFAETINTIINSWFVRKSETSDQFSIFWKRGFITLPWTGIPETTRLNFIAVRRAKSKTNMLLNLLSRSTPGGSRSDDQSTRCSLYPNPFHRTTACKKGTLSDFEEKWSDIPNLLFEAWEIIVRKKLA